ncbi:serine phosphatase RsbU (regulator of sigma subunit)/anti-sigma regulatory factor (Ser/Thr protein kinase) [Thermocatellispora tengchongensis]|uniref:protein-serine/threonine phosphatase n=1 Tax=Thermocatellispora tengchongensis TaxID=1073253 RepID=A0A840PED5_9ACTN|nr:SpoIIE family protein phosphatase [Thermocatellispora tengchongensis]MBB5136303.1 serine phosphatase RsbU (regulator of sigma subunit)/anti-sigma regulatory factor (Ser/Thr protein kinase) [Thermocatellispora tengchongensis]
MTAYFVVNPPSPDRKRLGSPASTKEQLALLNEASRRIGSTLSLSQTGRELTDVAVPRFADAADVLVHDRLVTEGEFPARPADGSAVVRRIALGTSSRADDYRAAFPIDEVAVYPSWSPYARCVATSQPILYPRMDAMTARELAILAKRDVVGALLEDSSFLVVPLQARGRVLGFAVFTRSPDSSPFHEKDVQLAEELAARTALCLDNARLYDRERRTALTLQSSLLPTDLPAPPGLEIASRYLPASDLTGVGGDWYDVIPLPGHRTALVVGDVMGHGTRAAATMGQLRTAARTLASLDLPPSEVLFRLNRMTQDLDATQIATCVYATYDPITHSCAIARAGHVPPVLLRPDGSTELIELPPGLPLGIGGDPFEMRQLTLPPGSVLTLYTDGLVESRDRDLDSGIRDLRRLLEYSHQDLEDLCDATIATQRPGDERDDIALLLARVRDLSPSEYVTWTLPFEAQSAAEARRLVRATLRAWGQSAILDVTELMVSELVANAVNHGTGPIELSLLRGATLLCEVADRSPQRPVRWEPEADDEAGRGLNLVNRFSYRWGTRPTATGKIVWCEVRLP